jgi:hypothetical protein
MISPPTTEGDKQGNQLLQQSVAPANLLNNFEEERRESGNR